MVTRNVAIILDMQYVQKTRLDMKLLRTEVNYYEFKAMTDEVIIVATIQSLDEGKSFDF